MVMEMLMAAIMAVETGGERDPITSVGTDGRSYGILQITDICRKDINRFSGEGFTRDDCFMVEKSKDMFRLYVTHYATERRLGRPPTYEDMSRIWNSGPNGWRKDCTLAYWFKVREWLDNNQE